MTTLVRTPLAEWRQKPDGSWEPVPTLGQSSQDGGGNPGGGSDFLTPDEVLGGDNIIITELPGGNILIEQGGHRIMYGGVPVAFQPNLDFQGDGVSVTDDAAHDKTIVTIDQGASSGAMRWKGDWDSGINYVPGDVVRYGDGAFVFTGPPFFFGFGYGSFGSGPFGSTNEIVDGFGAEGFGEGPFGG